MACHAMGSRWENAAGGEAERGRPQRWSGFEIAAMVLGFIVFWPVGLAILFWILWNKRQGRDVSVPDWVPRFSSWPMERPTGNSAFEEWKRAELARLEEERRRLAAAQAEFQAFLEQLKRARDREEFDRFMAARNKPSEA